jgi:hypothetical protein
MAPFYESNRRTKLKAFTYIRYMTIQPSKRSATVALGLGLLAGCSRSLAPDPCQPATFNAAICEDAVAHGGYYSNGTFIPHIYSNPYPYYYGNYGSYVSGGGRVTAAPASSYGVSRGGFGSTGEAASS